MTLHLRGTVNAGRGLVPAPVHSALQRRPQWLPTNHTALAGPDAKVMNVHKLEPGTRGSRQGVNSPFSYPPIHTQAIVQQTDQTDKCLHAY